MGLIPSRAHFVWTLYWAYTKQGMFREDTIRDLNQAGNILLGLYMWLSRDNPCGLYQEGKISLDTIWGLYEVGYYSWGPYMGLVIGR